MADMKWLRPLKAIAEDARRPSRPGRYRGEVSSGHFWWDKGYATGWFSLPPAGGGAQPRSGGSGRAQPRSGGSSPWMQLGPKYRLNDEKGPHPAGWIWTTGLGFAGRWAPAPGTQAARDYINWLRKNDPLYKDDGRTRWEPNPEARPFDLLRVPGAGLASDALTGK